MKKIKLFFIRHYQRFIRFLISFSAVSALVFGMAFSASAQTVYQASISQPQLTGNDCYLEIITANDWRLILYISFTQMPTASASGVDTGVNFYAYTSGSNFYVKPNLSSVTNCQLTGFYYDVRWNSVASLSAEQKPVPPFVYFSTANSGAVTKIHGYNCDVSLITGTSNDFVFTYGADTTFNNLLSSINSLAQQGVNNLSSISSSLVSIYNQNRSFFGSVNMEQILQAIKDNKSSAENSDYSSPDTSNATQYESAESELMATTSSGRSAAVDSMKGIAGLLDNHVGKSLLATSKLMSEFLGIDWLGDIVHFSLVCGLFAFVLGLSVYIFSNAGSNTRVANRRADTTNLHRNRLGK